MRLTFVLGSLFLSTVIVVIVGAWHVLLQLVQSGWTTLVFFALVWLATWAVLVLFGDNTDHRECESCESRKKRQEYLASHPCHECAFDESIWGVCSECHRTGGGDKDLWEEIQ